MQPDQQVAHEEEIVWLEDVAHLPYVREFIDHFTHFRCRRPAWHGAGRMVGYSTLRADATSSYSGFFKRRIFWLNTHDYPNPGPYSRDGCPCEAVDPQTVKPGEGKCTDRCYSRPS